MEENMKWWDTSSWGSPTAGFAFNPDGLWGFRTALDRVPRRIIRVSSRKGLALSTEAVAAWNDASGAGLQFGLAEIALNSEDYHYFAVVVGELIPEIARKDLWISYYPERGTLISSPLRTVFEPAGPVQQPESEASSNTRHTEPAATELQNLGRIEQNSKGFQTLQKLPLQSGPSEMSDMNTHLARLFTVDDEYTPSDALDLVDIR
ncbi:hypothetical protein MY1884_001478 [Beauveria asiatica]